MREAIVLVAAQLVCTIGMGWLALAMETHWEQVCSSALSRKARICLRTLGAMMLLASLGLCLVVEHASMAVLVWVMVLSASALAVSFTLTWRPHWLRAVLWDAPASPDLLH